MSLVGAQMARLARQAFAVVWVNPLKAHPDYEPLAAVVSTARAWSTGYSQSVPITSSGVAVFIDSRKPAPVPSASQAACVAASI